MAGNCAAGWGALLLLYDHRSGVKVLFGESEAGTSELRGSRQGQALSFNEFPNPAGIGRALSRMYT